MLNHKGTTALTTERLMLRRINMEDAEDIYSWMSDPKVMRPAASDLVESLSDVKKKIEQYQRRYDEQPNYYNWGLVLKDSGTLIGAIKTTSSCKRREATEVSYWLNLNYWGKGYLPEALNRVTEFLMNDVGYNTVEARILHSNLRSERVLIKCRFEHERPSKGADNDYFISAKCYVLRNPKEAYY